MLSYRIGLPRRGDSEKPRCHPEQSEGSRAGTWPITLVTLSFSSAALAEKFVNKFTFRSLARTLRDCLNGDLKVVSLRSETKFAGRTFRSTLEGVSLGCKAEGAEVKGKAMTKRGFGQHLYYCQKITALIPRCSAELAKQSLLSPYPLNPQLCKCRAARRRLCAGCRCLVGGALCGGL